MDETPRAAAFASQRPEPPRRAPTQVEDAVDLDLLRSALGGGDWRFQTLESGGVRLAGKFVAERAGRALFLKVEPAAHAETQAIAAALASSAAAAGAPAQQTLDGYPKPLDPGRIVIAAEYAPHRFACADQRDLEEVGRLVEALRRAFAEADPSLRERVRARSEARIAALEDEARRAVVDPAPGAPDEVAALIARRPFARDALVGPSAQPLHGDLNYGNVLFVAPADAAVAIDFETATRSFLDPIYDCAQAVDRFILTSGAEARPLFEAFSAGAGRPGDRADFLDTLDAVERLAVRSLLLLSAKARAGGAVAPSEWRKFVDTVPRLDRARALEGAA